MITEPPAPPLPTLATFRDMRALYGDATLTHFQPGCTTYTWHREDCSIVLIDLRTHRLTTTIPLPEAVDIGSCYA